MRTVSLSWIVGAVAALLLPHRSLAILTPAQQSAWTEALIPLPRQIVIDAAVTLAAADVHVRLRPDAGPAERIAAAQLTCLLAGGGDCAGPEVDAAAKAIFAGPGAGDGFEILLGVLGADGRLNGLDLTADAARLRHLPNPQQAYTIHPDGDQRLVLAALGEQGAWFAAQTLRQLLRGRVDAGRVTLPRVRVIDAPAVAQRGLWEGVFSRQELEWLSALKISAVNVHAGLAMTADGHGTIAPDLVRPLPPDIEGSYAAFCRSRGIRCIPIITHLSHLSRSGIYDYHPEVRGRGDSARHPTKASWIAPCTSEPALARVLGEWMAALAADHGADEVSVWLSEEQVRCGCDRCLATGQYVGETRAILAGWRQARRQHPDLRLQILLTQGSWPDNAAVLREVPPGDSARVVYYDGGRTYDASREPMIYPLLEDFVEDGGWLGVYPQVTASWAFVLPWHGPQFIRARMHEFTDKGLQAVIGYAVPDPLVHPCNIAAAAEWSWNPRGRNVGAFAHAWATRRGDLEPELFAAWVEELGSTSWDLYGSKFPLFYVWDDPARWLRTGTAPRLGEYVFHYFETPESFDDDLAACGAALDLARRMDDAELLQETRIVAGYVRMLRALYRISAGVADSSKPMGARLTAARPELGDLAAARDQVNGALRAWAPRRGVTQVSRFQGTLDVGDRIVTEVRAVLDSLAAAQVPGS